MQRIVCETIRARQLMTEDSFVGCTRGDLIKKINSLPVPECPSFKSFPFTGGGRVKLEKNRLLSCVKWVGRCDDASEIPYSGTLIPAFFVDESHQRNRPTVRSQLSEEIKWIHGKGTTSESAKNRDGSVQISSCCYALLDFPVSELVTLIH